MRNTLFMVWAAASTVALSAGPAAQQRREGGDVEVLPVHGSIYLIAGGGGNIAASVGKDGVLLVDSGAAPMTDKVLAAIPKRDGGHYWMRCGNGHTNKDDSINIYLDVVPRDLKFQLRELDEEDLRKREAYRASHGGTELASPADSPPF